MLFMGVVFLVVFAVWDLRYASMPVIAPRFVKNRSVVCAAFIGFFDFVSVKWRHHLLVRLIVRCYRCRSSLRTRICFRLS